MQLRDPKPLDLALKDRENPWFQIEFYGRFLAAGLTGVQDVLADDVLDMIELLDTKKKSFGKRADYDKVVKGTARLAKELAGSTYTPATKNLLQQFWLSLHKARNQLP